MKKVLLDTNAYTNLLRGNISVLNILSSADIVYMSIIVLGELFAGFKGGSRAKENNEYLQKFISQPTVQVLHANEETASIFAEIKFDLKKSGTPIPINDVWISAHAIETGATLITFDAYFGRVKGLRLWDELN